MRIAVRSWSSCLASALLVIFASGFALSADNPHYVITNDDVPPPLVSSVTLYNIGAQGQLTRKGKVLTGRGGIGGGYFSANRVSALDSGKSQCIFASQAATGAIVSILVSTLKVAGSASGSKNDGGTSNGIGLASNSKYLYASFTDSNTIGTFQVKAGCKLKFVSDITVGGLQGGVIAGMVVHGGIMVATYGDGSIESFNIAAGAPVSNGDKQNSTGSRGGNTYPNGIVITQDGHFAIFGDTASSTVVEVSDISSGKLTPTLVYHLGGARNSSNVLLSPDETMLYISNNQAGKITAAFFDKATGVLTKGCVSGTLRGFDTDWAYVASLALQNSTGTGSTIYAAEFGAPASIGIVDVQSSSGTCTLKEAAKSPVADPNSPGLLSIGTFPPAPF